MDEFLTDKEVALILTVIGLVGQQPTPAHVQQAYQRAKEQVEEARRRPDSYPLNQRRNMG